MGESTGNSLPITFHPITDQILEQLKVLNGVIFPIKYQVTPCLTGLLFIDIVCSL